MKIMIRNEKALVITYKKARLFTPSSPYAKGTGALTHRYTSIYATHPKTIYKEVDKVVLTYIKDFSTSLGIGYRKSYNMIRTAHKNKEFTLEFFGTKTPKLDLANHFPTYKELK